MPEATETDRFCSEDVWSPQELEHGVLLDAVQHGLGMRPTRGKLSRVSVSIRLARALSRLPGMLGVIRLFYDLTGAAIERSPVVAAVVAPVRRQEPGHFAFYRMSADSLIRDEGLRDWQLQLARILRRGSFELGGCERSPGARRLR
jgi:hypothetical protein